MYQAGRRTITDQDQEAQHMVPRGMARIDLFIYVDLSRLLPTDTNLADFQQLHNTPSLTEFPVMHLVQARDLNLEIDEIKKAVQEELWSLLGTLTHRSSFYLAIGTYCTVG